MAISHVAFLLLCASVRSFDLHFISVVGSNFAGFLLFNTITVDQGLSKEQNIPCAILIHVNPHLCLPEIIFNTTVSIFYSKSLYILWIDDMTSFYTHS